MIISSQKNVRLSKKTETETETEAGAEEQFL